jgi:hypothetical protein
VSVQHTLNLYQKPKAGNAFMSRYPVFNYKHRIITNGGFDTASCQIAVDSKVGEVAIEQWIGNRVAIFVQNAAVPIWEGLISRVTLKAGAAVFTASLDEMFNRVRVTFSQKNVAINTQYTTPVNNTTSQGIYGIKEGNIDALGSGSNSADVTAKTTLANRYLATRAYPKVSTAFAASSANDLLSIEMIGIYHTLKWETYDPGAETGAITPAAWIPFLFVTVGASRFSNLATFFDNTDTTKISSNVSFNAPLSRGTTYWDSMLALTEPGDGSARWITGITPTDPNTGTRRLYYAAANTTIEYTLSTRRDVGRVRSIYGAPVPPWEVRPDRGVRVMDILTGWNLTGDDPREFYLEAVNYDAESQTVSLQSSDNIELEGALQLDSYYKAMGTRFGPSPRTVY